MNHGLDRKVVGVRVVFFWSGCNGCSGHLTTTARSIYLSICLSVYLSASLKTKLFCETSSVVDLDSIKKEAGLQDFRCFSTWQRQKRSNSVSCQHQKQCNSTRLPSNMESWVQSQRPRTNAIFPFHLSEVHWSTAPATKKWRQVIRSAAPVTQSSSQNWRSDAPKCNPSQEISARTS